MFYLNSVYFTFIWSPYSSQSYCSFFLFLAFTELLFTSCSFLRFYVKFPLLKHKVLSCFSFRMGLIFVKKLIFNSEQLTVRSGGNARSRKPFILWMKVQLMIFLIIQIPRPFYDEIPVPPVCSYDLAFKSLNIPVHLIQLSLSLKFLIQKLLNAFFLLNMS